MTILSVVVTGDLRNMKRQVDNEFIRAKLAQPNKQASVLANIDDEVV